MNFLEKAILGVSPGWAVNRARARAGALAYYESARPSHLRKQRKDNRSPDLVNREALSSLLAQARHFDENFDIGAGALTLLVNNIVGLGLVPDPQVRLKSGDPAVELNQQIRELFKEWSKAPEVTGQHDYADCQRLKARAWCRDGEVFTQYITGNAPGLAHNTGVKFSIEMLECDFVPHTLNRPEKNIIQGVKVNDWNRPLLFYVHKHHPRGDRGRAIATEKLKTIQAGNMQHLKLVKRINQTRGITVFAPAMSRFDDIKEIDETERVAARIAAAASFYIKKGNPDTFDDDKYADAEKRYLDMDPGIIFDDLRPGEDVGSITSNRPNNAVIPFRDSQMKAAANIGVGYSSLSRNYNGSFSAQRQELVEQYATYGVFWSYFSARETVPTHERFVMAAELSNMLDISDEVDRATLLDVDVGRVAMPWVDPVKEAKGFKELHSLGVETLTNIVRARGRNPDVIKRTLELEKDWPVPNAKVTVKNPSN